MAFLGLCKRREGLEEVFAAWDDLVTYRVDAVRKQSALRRLVGLARALTFDRIDEGALARVKNLVVERMRHEIHRLRDGGQYDTLAQRITGIGLKTLTLQQETGVAEPGGEYVIETAAADIDRQFEQAGRSLGNGLPMEYWHAHADRDAEDVKVEVIVLAQDSDGMRGLEQFAETEFDRLYEERRREISGLREQRRGPYEKLQLATATPQDIPWHLPETIDFRRTAHAPLFERHLYLEDDGHFRADLGSWEREVIESELTNSEVVGWLRNVDRKSWSLEIPYRDGGAIRPMFPDLVVVRRDSRGWLFDILEPHDPSRNDNFAEKHGHLFSRIQ